jgi:NAD(P)H-dependent flavin oxidoreductase YrpB (nitropropane dioxygenase family)
MVEKLHASGILCANMVGAPHHVKKAIDVGMDIIIAQGTEGGGHTGDCGTMVLIRQVLEEVQGKTSAFTKGPIMVCAAGGIADGQGLAAALSLGAEAVWVGTRFVCAEESTASLQHTKNIIQAKATDTVRTLVFSGRPLRVMRTPYVESWEVDRKSKIQELCDQGIIPWQYDFEQMEKMGQTPEISKMMPHLMGQCAGLIHDVKPAKVIMEDMMTAAIATIRRNSSLISRI